MTTAQQVAHAAQTIYWFIEGAFGPAGFSMDFESMAKVVAEVKSLQAAREWFDKSVASASATLGAKSDADLLMPLPPGPIMGGMPRMAIVGAITDHTAHHGGVLTCACPPEHNRAADALHGYVGGPATIAVDGSISR